MNERRLNHLACGTWNNTTDNIERMYFVASGPTCICSGSSCDTATNNLVVYSSVANGYGFNNNLVVQKWFNNNSVVQIILISGTTILNNNTTIYSSLYVSGLGATILNNLNTDHKLY